MAYFKAYPGRSSPAPSEWDLELYNLDFSSEDPNDSIETVYPLRLMDNWEMVFKVNTDRPAYDNNNNIGLFTLNEDPTPEPDAVDASIQIAINNYALTVFVRGRLYLSQDTNPDHVLWGAVTGYSESFQGDYRNKEIKVTSTWGLDWRGFALIDVYAIENGISEHLTTISLLGYPHWNEDHTAIISDSVSLNNTLVIGSWYGGAGHHQFDGHLDYFKFKKTEPPT